MLKCGEVIVGLVVMVDSEVVVAMGSLGSIFVGAE